METLIFLTILFILGIYSTPLYVWYVFIGVYSFVFFDVGAIFWTLFAVTALVFLVRPLRASLVSKRIVDFINKKHLLPKISPTEEAALRAGTTWVESSFFRAEVDFDAIKKEKITTLTKEEEDFLNNEVETLCEMTSDWEIFQDRDLRDDVWQYIKDKKFFGMIIPKEYDGLGFSATMHSRVIEKLVSRSQVLAITVMVPNSLGPAELILKHGTKRQQDYYLPRLANGLEVPCFGLTEPNAGSDATSIKSNGVLFKDENNEIKIKLNFEKRYITLGNIATLIGLAFVLKDPNHILGEKEDLGITFGLIDHKAEGLDNSQRHDPLGIPFVNSPLYGKDVIISINDIIGGKSGIGHGWQMLVESLSIGRGISLPSVSLGASKYALNVVSSYTNIREQFGLNIKRFEGVEEKLAKITAFTYLLNASRNFTLDAIDNGVKPGVVNSIMKYHATEKFREVINDSMDILGGAAIIRGEKNLLAHAYFAIPISITVEGANILTRNLMQFGQGLIKCHPYLYGQVQALQRGDVDDFDNLLFSHISMVNTSVFKTLFYYLTRAKFVRTEGEFKRFKQKLVWVSSSFTLLSNTSLLFYGGDIKKRENISARFGDILSWCYLITSTLREYDNNPKEEFKPLVQWLSQYGFAKIQEAQEELFANMPIFKYLLPLSRVNSYDIKPKDSLNKKVVAILDKEELFDELCEGIFISNDKEDTLTKLNRVSRNVTKNSEVLQKISNSVKLGKINKASLVDMAKEALELDYITKIEYESLIETQELKNEVIQVDSYDVKTYKSQK